MSQGFSSFGGFPATRMRRNRRNDLSRGMVREHRLSPDHFIYPVFVLDEKNTRQPVPSMPGVERVSIDLLAPIAERCLELRVPVLALFPVIDLRRILRVRAPLAAGVTDNVRERLLVIVESGRSVVGLAVDELLEQHQVVIKSLENNFVQVPGTLGATILGDGTVSLIVDIPGMVRLAGVRGDVPGLTPAAA